MFLQPKPGDPGRPRRQWRDVMDADGKHSARSRNRQACSASCPANQVALRSTKLIRMRLTSREFPMRALSVLSLIAGTLAFCSPALAHCRVTDLNLDQAISRQNELRQSANAQVVRDLRTLREAALILEANRHIIRRHGGFPSHATGF